MRILATCDLHYGSRPAADSHTHALAKAAIRAGGDALIIAGDVAGPDKSDFSACLDLFRDFPGLRLVVPGNHDMWSTTQEARELYEQELPARAVDAGFKYLDVAPVVMGPVAFVGSMAWYDYRFAISELGAPDGAYGWGEWVGVGWWKD